MERTVSEEQTSARRLLDLLVQADRLELVEGVDLDALATAMAPRLAAGAPPSVAATALLDWLVDRDEVEEVFLSEEDLTELLKRW